MDNHERFILATRAVAALEAIAVNIEKLSSDGMTIYGGSTMEEN